MTPQSKCLNCGYPFTRAASHRTGAFCSGECQRAYQARSSFTSVRIVDTPSAESPALPVSVNRRNGEDNRGTEK